MPHKDGQLEEKCVQELPRIILKMTRAYLSLVRWMEEIRETDIEKVWPKMYTLNIIKFQCDNDLLMAFFKSGLVVFGAEQDVYVPEQEFIKRFHQFCKDQGSSAYRYPWKPSVYEAVFKDNGVRRDGNLEDRR